ncbi:MAG: hypothetical protein JW881_05965 [Spirochaetales bacterium]|nr:hypothetical protein [Spirochaetales bacterium]
MRYKKLVPSYAFVFISSILLLIPLYTARADLVFDIRLPVFAFAETLEIENSIDEYFDDYNDSIETEIQKKNMMKAFSEANAFSFSSIAHPAAGNIGSFAVTLDMTVSGQSFTFDTEEISSSLVDTTEGSDSYLGFGLQLFTVTLLFYPEAFLDIFNTAFPGLLIGINCGASSFSYNDYRFRSFNAGVSLFYPLFDDMKPFPALTWRPLTLATGISYVYNKIVKPVQWDFSIPVAQDPDGLGGPVPVITGEAEISSDPDVGICSRTFVVPVSGTTSLDIGWFLMLDLGCGFDMLFGRAYVSIEDEADITISGDMASYVDTPGSLSVKGSINENAPDFIRFRVTAAAGIRIDPVWIKIPFVYYFDYGLSAGIKMGMSY